MTMTKIMTMTTIIRIAITVIAIITIIQFILYRVSQRGEGQYQGITRYTASNVE